MVMPCGLTPVDGIGFVDWFLLLHVCMCPHTHKYTVRCLQKTVVHQSEKPPQFVHKHRTLLKELRGTDTTLHINSRLDALPEPVCGSVSEGVSQSHAQFTSVEVSHPVGF
ncbi:hypothetical protein CHARACLAT_018590 [Characodon lateralis]|uniref:Secreted protein n=1 Tax=Characodon lateralis TaxID=208331 RepID=A0ABU7EKA0_9TELE|nr:hypothetical protein [Characodon lateralis]